MKKILLAGVAMGALVSAANAADMMVPRPVYKASRPVAAPVPLYSWTGCHVGGHIGWGWTRKDLASVNSAAAVDGEGTGGGNNNDLVSLPNRLDGDGFLGGAQAGCDYQLGFLGGFLSNFVIGFSGSISAADINGNGNEIPLSTNGNGNNNNNLVTPGGLHFHEDRIESITGRLGFALGPRALLYVRGGWAWTHDKFDISAVACELAGKSGHCKGGPHDQALAASFIEDRHGWTIGGGIEMPVAFLQSWLGSNWTWFVEYNHYDFGTKSEVLGGTSGPGNSGGGATVDLSIKQKVDTLITGFNYRFWSGEGFEIGKGKAPIAARY